MGVARTYLRVFLWLKWFCLVLGNDDLVMPSAFEYLFKLFKEKSKLIFFISIPLI